MIRGFSKIIKIFLGLIGVFFLFIVFVVTAITSVPLLTGEHYQDNESPSYIFNVVLESLDSPPHQPQFECVRWDDFKEMHPQAGDQNVYVSRDTYKFRDSACVSERKYTTDLSVSEGWCTGISSYFIVQNVDAHTRVVKLRWAQETFKVRNIYRLEDTTVIPLYLCEFLSEVIAIGVFLGSIIATVLTIILFRISCKNFGKFVSTGLAFILIGLCSLNIAVLDRGMSLDPLTENPEYFIFRMNILFLLSGILFVCAALSFWIHKRKRLRTGKEG